MKKSLSLLLFLLAWAGTQTQAQDAKPHSESRDSVLMKSTIYYSTNQGEWIEPAYYKTAAGFLHWAQTDKTTPIVITGWADNRGSKALNDKLSRRRAKTIRNYLVQRGIKADRILFEGCGIDTQAASNDKARRAEVCGVIAIAQEPVDEIEPIAQEET